MSSGDGRDVSIHRCHGPPAGVGTLGPRPLVLGCGDSSIGGSLRLLLLAELPGQFKAGSSAVTGKISAGVLTLDALPNGAMASFAMQPDGALAGTYVLSGQMSTGTFRKS